MSLLYLLLNVKIQSENFKDLEVSWEALLGRNFQLVEVRQNFARKGEPSRRQSGP